MTRDELEQLTVAELRELAAEREVDISGIHLKADLVDALEETPAADAPEGEELDVTEDDVGGPRAGTPLGLKLPSGLTAKEMEAAIKDNWRKRVEDDGTEQWVNQGDFKVPGGAVPQGTVRPLDEAYALEVQRVG